MRRSSLHPLLPPPLPLPPSLTLCLSPLLPTLNRFLSPCPPLSLSPSREKQAFRRSGQRALTAPDRATARRRPGPGHEIRRSRDTHTHTHTHTTAPPHGRAQDTKSGQVAWAGAFRACCRHADPGSRAAIPGRRSPTHPACYAAEKEGAAHRGTGVERTGSGDLKRHRPPSARGSSLTALRKAPNAMRTRRPKARRTAWLDTKGTSSAGTTCRSKLAVQHTSRSPPAFLIWQSPLLPSSSPFRLLSSRFLSSAPPNAVQRGGRRARRRRHLDKRRAGPGEDGIEHLPAGRGGTLRLSGRRAGSAGAERWLTRGRGRLKTLAQTREDGHSAKARSHGAVAVQ